MTGPMIAGGEMKSAAGSRFQIQGSHAFYAQLLEIRQSDGGIQGIHKEGLAKLGENRCFGPSSACK